MLKVLVLGESGVGKTCLVRCYTEDGSFPERAQPTVGFDAFRAELQGSSSSGGFAVQLWDTAGDERLKALQATLWRDADAAVIVFSLADAATLERAVAQRWAQRLRDGRGRRPPVVLVGTKADLVHLREVSPAAASAAAAELGADAYLEVSALRGDNVAECFEALADALQPLADERAGAAAAARPAAPEPSDTKHNGWFSSLFRGSAEPPAAAPTKKRSRCAIM